MRCYIDADILIWFLRGERKAYHFIKELSAREGNELWIGALQRAEVVFFMREKEERATLQFLSRFKTQPLTAPIVDKAGCLYRDWHDSHGVDVNDAMLAATAEATGGRIFTLNIRHYPMPGLEVGKAW